MNAPFTDHAELKKAIVEHIERAGPHCSLNHLDVSQIVNFSELFENSLFNGDISQWNVSSGKYFDSMFRGSSFNGDISNWNMSSATNLKAMFCCSLFQGDISRWNISNVTTLDGVFSNSIFNGDISRWDVSNVRNLNFAFAFSKFQGDISRWNTRNVQTMRATFADIDYLGDISNWDLSAVILTNSERCFTRYHHSPLYFVEVLSGRQRPPEHLREQLNQYIPLVVSLNMPPLDAARWLMQQLTASPKKNLGETFEVPTDLMVK